MACVCRIINANATTDGLDGIVINAAISATEIVRLEFNQEIYLAQTRQRDNNKISDCIFYLIWAHN